MKLTLGWPDGERREETDVVDFSVQWVGDEWLVRLTYRDGSDDVFTGKDIRVMSGEEIDAKTYAAKP